MLFFFYFPLKNPAQSNTIQNQGDFLLNLAYLPYHLTMFNWTELGKLFKLTTPNIFALLWQSKQHGENFIASVHFVFIF